MPGKLRWGRSDRGEDDPKINLVKPHTKGNQTDRPALEKIVIGQIGADQGCPRPAITILIKNKPHIAVLDSQASDTFVSDRLINYLAYTTTDYYKTVMGAAQDVSYTVKGKTILQAKCANVNIEIPAFVIKGLISDVIFGHDFLVKYGAVLDYNTNEIFFGKNTRVRLAWRNDKRFSESKRVEQNLEEFQVGPLEPNQKHALTSVLTTFPEVITDKIGYTSTVKHEIKCSSNEPIKQRPYPLNPDRRAFVYKKIQEMENEGLIEPSNSNWASPIVLPKKKNGEYRLCVDFRKLNLNTVSDAYPMPDLKNLLRKVNGAKVFSTLDLNSGYWQVEVKEESRPMTAFTTPRGLYQFRVMPFGLKNAPATFMRLMDEVLAGYVGEFCQVYLDDILIYSKSFTDHLVHLAKVLERLKIHGLTCQVKKCHFAAPKVEYLGHVLSADGLERQAEKNKAIEEAERPRTKRQIRQFLGLCGWYSSFVPHFEGKAAPLTDLLNNKVPFKWTDREEKAFSEIKYSICNAPKLAHPDPNRKMCLQTDASDIGLGAILFQLTDQGDRKIIEYASRKLSHTEKNYCTAEKEALAVIWAVGKFRGYLEGRKFQLYTDNSSLQWLNRVSSTKSKLMRWALLLADFDFDICHVAGQTNQAADSLSRNPAAEPESNDNLPEREVPECSKDTESSPVLLAMSKETTDIDMTLIQKWQEEDNACRRMKSWIRRRSTCAQGVPSEFSMCYKNFRLEKDILWYVSIYANTKPVAVIPRVRADTILEKYHDSTEAGHPGQEETYTSIRRRFFWVRMRQDIKNYVQACRICACTKASNQKASSSQRGRRPSQPWEVLAVDLMGPYPRTSRGKTGIFVVTDLFTRWVEAFAIPEATSGRLLGLLKAEVFSRYGYPRCLLTDNGTQFTSKSWSEALNQWGIEHWTTPIYHPQANPTERRNQELKRLFRIHLVDQSHNKWDQYLQECLFSVRQRVNRVTGYSPAELFLGRPLRRTGDWGLESSGEVALESTTSWHQRNQHQIQRMQDEVTERTRKEAEAGDSADDMQLEPGQLVLRRNHALSNKLQGFHSGLAPKWLGPFEVERKLGKGVYLLKSSPPTKVHASELKILQRPLRNLDKEKGEVQPGAPQGPHPEPEEGQRDDGKLPENTCRYNLRSRLRNRVNNVNRY